MFEWRPALSDQAWALWQSVGHHHNVLEVAREGWIRYAAIDWSATRVAIGADTGTVRRVATWGMVIARALEDIQRVVGVDRMGLFAVPVVRFDLEGAVRIGFGSGMEVGTVPPELYDTFPRCDGRGLAFVVGRALGELAAIPAGSELGRVASRCIAKDPAARYPTLESLCGGLRVVGAGLVIRSSMRKPRVEWNAIEHALGRLAVGNPQAAGVALGACKPTPMVMALSAIADARGEQVRAAAEPEPLPAEWAHQQALVEKVRAARDFQRARAIIESCPDAPRAEVAKGRLDAGLPELALDAAREAGAHALVVAALAALRWHREMLAAAEAWVAATGEAEAHHARGVALLKLKRLVEAREAFDRAPKLLIARLLRRECDRMLRCVRDKVGEGAAMTLEVPSHLGELRELIAANRLDEAIAFLEARRGDATADLLLGEVLAFVGRFDEALMAFDAAAPIQRIPATLGAARCLTALGRSQEAEKLLEMLPPEATRWLSE